MSWSILKKIKLSFRQKLFMVNSARTSSHASLRLARASLTFEAAVVLPLFLIGMLTLISVMDLQRIKTEINVSLNQSVKELGMYAFVMGENEEESPVGQIDDAICMAYAMGSVEGNKQVTLHSLKSSYAGHNIELWLSGNYQPIVSLIPGLRMPFQNRVRVHDWRGYDGGTKEESSHTESGEMVYVTDHQSVYHTSSKCTHLDLSITRTTTTQVNSLRNEGGGKYHECEHCIGKNGHEGIAYITKTGDRYHGDGNCQGLKRSTKLVLKDSLGAIAKCSRCQEREG